MTIKKVDGDTPIARGQWINKDSSQTDGICGTPKLVEAVSGTRVYITGEDDRTTYIAKSSIAFVCDTKEEADSLYALHRQMTADLSSTKLAIIESYLQRVEQMVG